VNAAIAKQRAAASAEASAAGASARCPVSTSTHAAATARLEPSVLLRPSASSASAQNANPGSSATALTKMSRNERLGKSGEPWPVHRSASSPPRTPPPSIRPGEASTWISVVSSTTP